MEGIMIINGSPRAPRSNSKQYAELFMKACPCKTAYFNLTKTNHLELCQKIKNYSDLLFVFPLYADGIPATMLSFLTTLEKDTLQHKPTVSVLINCGFIEPEQNDVAIKMIQFFCNQNQFPFGSVLKIGSGEAILSTPFVVLIRSKIKKFIASIRFKKYCILNVTMPITKKMFIKASTTYWINYGKRNDITEKQMSSMKIELK